MSRLMFHVKRVLNFLRLMALTVFGNLRWNPPPWLNRLRQQFQARVQPYLAKAYRRSRQWAAQNPLLVRRGGLALLLILVTGISGYIWWQRQPKPQLVTWSIRDPEPMALEPNALPHPLVIRFLSSAAPLDQVGKVVDKGVEMSPKIEGSWKWESDRSLVFTPVADWPIDQQETVSFAKKYFPSHLHLERYSREFNTPRFKITQSQGEFYQHPDNPKEKRVTATLRVSHPVSPESLKGRVTISLEGDTEVLGKIPREYKANVTYDKFFGEIYIQSEHLPLPLKDTKAKIHIAKGLVSSHGGNRIDKDTDLVVNIPGMFSFFKIENAQVHAVENKEYVLEQVITLESTTEVLESEFDKSLEVYLLPADQPKENGHGVHRNYDWQGGEVTPDVLKKSERLKVTRIPSERPQTKLHNFKIDVPVNRSLFVRLNKGLKSFHEYILAETFESALRVRPYPREIRILHEGAILSMSGDKKLSVLTRGVDAFQVEVGHVLPDQLNHLISQSGGDFSKPEFMSSYQFSWDNISEKFTEVIDVATAHGGKPEFGAFDAGKFLNKAHGGARGLLYVTLRPYNHKTKHAEGSSESRFLLVTDLGIIEKRLADKSHEIFVQSVHSGQPVAGARVEVIGKNGLAILNTTTDGQGRAHLPSLEDFKMEKTPLAVVVQNGGDLSFLPFHRYDRQLQYSRFDVGGVHTGGETDSLRAYVFTDRGLYRPGETFHLSGIVRSFDWKTALNGVPLEWVVSDPKGQEMYKEKVTLDRNGFLELTSQTQEASFVGTYTGSLFLLDHDHRSGLVGSTTFRVEEFVPDRMKIAAGFSVAETAGWVLPEGLKGWVRVKNMFGFPAEGRKVSANYSLHPAAPYFSAYKDYRFYFQKTDKSYNENLNSSETNSKGEVEYEMDMSRFEKGNYQLRFEAEAFEAEGGRSVVAQASIMVSPSKYFIGYKTDADLSYLKLGSTATVDLLAINSSLKKTAVGDLTLSLIEKQWISVLTKQNNGTFKYESVQRDRDVKKDKFKMVAGDNKVPLPTTDPGDYKLVVSNGEGREVAIVEFSVIGQGNVLGRIDRSAELQIKLSRADYSAGEEIEMQIRAPYTGAGLITIERDKVYAQKWFKTSSTNSLQTIRIPAGLEGNAYVNVTFLRDLNSREIFMSPLSYGVAPFSVDMKKRQIKVGLKVDAESRPGTPLKIEYTGSKPGKIIIFAVDEGILQVAKYQTPDPLKVFFQKRALEIETSQLLDLVLPEYRIVKELAASGGDAEFESQTARNLNPFRRKGKPPVAFWSGMIDVDPTKRTVTYNLPDYFNGTLRVMAVAVSPDGIGVMRTDTLVRGDFIITPTVPFVLTPGDEAVVGVSVFNNAKGSGPNAKIKLAFKGSEHLEILEAPKAELEIPETKEVSTTLRVRAKDSLGVASLTFTASLGAKTSSLSEDLSLRPASPYRTAVWAGVTKGSATVALDRKIYPEFAKRSLAVSFLPLTLAHGLAEYLEGFPYGCTEQLMSKAIPQLVLGDKPDFKVSPEKREKAFRGVLATLRQRQTSDGGFGLYWSYGASVPFPSLYAIHYLVEAKERGFGVPLDMQERAKGYLRGYANQTAQSLTDARMTAYALYLLARLGQNVGNEINTLAKEIEASTFKKAWPTDIGALFMASTYKLLQQEDLAAGLARGVVMRADYFADWNSYYDTYVHNAMTVYLLARHFPTRLKGESDAAVDTFVTMIQQGHYNTLNTAMAILALEALSKADNHPVEVVAQVSEVDAKGGKVALTLPKSLFPTVAYSAAAVKLDIVNSGDQRVYYEAHQAGYDRLESLHEIKDKIEIQREYRAAGSTSTLSTMKIGDEAEVHLKIRTTDGASRHNVAIVDLIPSGFEVVLERRAHSEARCEIKPKREVASLVDLLLPKASAQEGEGEGDEGYSEGERSSEEGDDDSGESKPARRGPHASTSVETSEAAEVPTLAMPGSNLTVEFEDPREDRVVLYATISGEMHEYIYKIKATNRGKFKVPPAFAEDMYDRSAQALGPIGSIEVDERVDER